MLSVRVSLFSVMCVGHIIVGMRLVIRFVSRNSIVFLWIFIFGSQGLEWYQLEFSIFLIFFIKSSYNSMKALSLVLGTL